MSDFCWYVLATNTVIAQAFKDPDFLGQIQQAWTHFVSTGQIWALLIGLVVGYIFRNLTTYS